MSGDERRLSRVLWMASSEDSTRHSMKLAQTVAILT